MRKINDTQAYISLAGEIATRDTEALKARTALALSEAETIRAAQRKAKAMADAEYQGLDIWAKILLGIAVFLICGSVLHSIWAALMFAYSRL